MKSTMKTIKCNKGSGILTVMLAVLFLTAFGSLALYLTYTSFQVVASDRISKEISYNANTCMEEIKAGIQDIVSDAIEATYNEVMPDYTYSAGDITQKFADAYFENVINWDDGNGNSLFAFGPDNQNGTYDTAAIQSLIKEKRGYDCDVTGSINDEKGTVTVEEDGIVLKGIKVTFVGKNNKKSSVRSDIKIGIPDIGYLLTQYSIKGIPEFTLICNGELSQKNVSGDESDTVITGSAYAGSISLENNTSMKIKENATMICKGNVSVKGTGDSDGRFFVGPNSTLWAGNVEIGPYSSATLRGTTYVANDLLFNGTNASATLKGTYYGFGNSESDSSKSSSIISNMKGAHLDLQGLNQLTLAGVSYVNNNDRFGTIDDLNSESYSNASGVRMGESLSGKLNQKLYYAPYDSVSYYTKIISSGYEINDIEDPDGAVHYIETDENGVHHYFKYVTESEGEDPVRVDLPDEPYNPKTSGTRLESGQSKITIFSKSDFFKIDHFDFNTTVNSDVNKPFSDYGITLKPIYKWHDSDTVMVYFFMEFDTQENANRYFIDYYEKTVEDGNYQVANWQDGYLSVSRVDYPLKITSGAVYMGFDDNHSLINPVTIDTESINSLRTEADFISQIFSNFCKTLTNTIVTTDATNPFDYYVKVEQVEDIIDTNGVMNFYSRNKLTAKVVNGNYTYDGSDEYLCLIVSTGNVTVTSDFEGLIICAGDIIINSKAQFRSSSERVIAAFVADNAQDEEDHKVEGEYQFRDFFNVDISQQYTESESKEGDAWNVAKLVTFSNWKRL